MTTSNNSAQTQPLTFSGIRRATEDDIPALLGLAQRFIDEISLPYTYDYEASYKTYYMHIHHGILLVADYNGAIGGLIMGTVDKEFAKEYSAYITKLYVEKEFRGLGTSRELIKEFEKIAGKAIVFTSASAGISERVEKLYNNLFKKAGYNTLGQILVRALWVE